MSFEDTSQGQGHWGSVACGVEASSLLVTGAGISMSEALAKIGSIEPHVPQFNASTELRRPHSGHRTVALEISWLAFIGVAEDRWFGRGW